MHLVNLTVQTVVDVIVLRLALISRIIIPLTIHLDRPTALLLPLLVVELVELKVVFQLQ